MSSWTKASKATSLNLSAIADGEAIDAGDFLTPLEQTEAAIDEARATFSVSGTDKNVKTLDSALAAGFGIKIEPQNVGGDETLLISVNDAEVAPAGHDHDGEYAPVEHNHDGVYAPVEHNHDGVYAPAGHDHDEDYEALGAVSDHEETTDHPEMTGAAAETPGAKGMVPAPAAGDQEKVLVGGGVWGEAAALVQFIGCVVKRTTDQAISVGAMTFPDEEWDTDAMHDGSGDYPERVTIRTAGKYLVLGAAECTNGGSNTFAATIVKNDAEAIGLNYGFLQPAGGLAGGISAVGFADLAVDDYVTLDISSSETKNFQGFLGVHRLGD